MTTSSSGNSAGRRRLAQDAKPATADASRAGVPVWLVCLLLAAATLGVFGRTLGFEFVNFDDGDYVFQNPSVAAGLTTAGVERAFTRGSLANWDPLTTLSHMLDCQWYGLNNPGGHHLTNVLLHTASVVLLFLVLRRMTGALWRSALVAALFAIHPLRVESVAWVSERKDVLSGLFFMLTLGAYVGYANASLRLRQGCGGQEVRSLRQAPAGSRPMGPKSKVFYLLVLVLFALGLMSKAMLVTLPFVLLLLDWWPLNRFARREGAPGMARLLLEKVPLIVLSGAAGVVSVICQNQAHAVGTLEKLSMSTRLGNALISCGWYVGKMFWPSNLAVLYPYPVHALPPGEVVAGALVVAGISGAAIRWRRERPYLLVGWLWFLVMLLPVIGLVQLGAQARADRYTYLPQIGLYAALSWLAGSVTAEWPRLRTAIAGVMVAALSGLGAGAFIQTGYWRNSEQLWVHTLACTADNPEANYNYGIMLVKAGHTDEAIARFQTAVNLLPDYADAFNSLGYAYMEKGLVADAITNLQRALELKPDLAEAHNNLGRAFSYVGRFRDAAGQYDLALQEKPDFAEAHFNYGNLFLRAKGTNEAITQYLLALKANTNLAGAHNNLATILLAAGQTNEAIEHFEKALGIETNLQESLESLNRIAWKMATSPQASERDGARSLAIGQFLVRTSGGADTMSFATLAAAEAETGDFDQAAADVAKAQKIATDGGEKAVANLLGGQLKLYQAHTPYRDTNSPARKRAVAPE